MKSNKNQTKAVAVPLVKELAKRLMKAPVDSKPLKQAALYQDAGNGYRGNFTFPQD